MFTECCCGWRYWSSRFIREHPDKQSYQSYWPTFCHSAKHSSSIHFAVISVLEIEGKCITPCFSIVLLKFTRNFKQRKLENIIGNTYEVFPILLLQKQCEVWT